MLVLSRRPGQSIVIGDGIEVTVLSVQGDVVRLGVVAPRSVAVHRREVYDAVQAENRRAATASRLPEVPVPPGTMADAGSGAGTTDGDGGERPSSAEPPAPEPPQVPPGA
ncbi:MAG: carbon storage regulator CsrA [Clostridia bacterium]|nr:carbon storage regulator CsrA [Clostridia bacterium]